MLPDVYPDEQSAAVHDAHMLTRRQLAIWEVWQR